MEQVGPNNTATKLNQQDNCINGFMTTHPAINLSILVAVNNVFTDLWLESLDTQGQI